MALVVKNRVKETSVTAGTGTITLAGAVSGFQSFSAVGNGNTTTYAIVDSAAGTWEVGIGTYTAAGTTLARTTVLASSNSGSLVNFSSNSKDVFVDYPAEYAVYANGFGTSGQFLKSSGAGVIPTWSALPAATPGTTGVIFAQVNNLCVGQQTAIGACTGYGQYPGGVAVGFGIGYFQGGGAVAVGCGAGGSCQTANSVAIGAFAGACTQLKCGPSTAVGYQAGGTRQCQYAVAVGVCAGYYFQQQNATAIGYRAGYCNQASYSVAVGHLAGKAHQGFFSVAVGACAGNCTQGCFAVAIGYQAGATNQPIGTIIINATGGPLNADGNTRAYMAPVRNSNGAAYNLQYNTASKEITYTGLRSSYMAAPVAKSATVTLTAAEVLVGYLNHTPLGAATYTLPTGSALNTAQGTVVANTAFTWSVINTGGSTVTVAVNTGITSLGSLTIASGTSGTFQIRYTAANTYIIYRI